MVARTYCIDLNQFETSTYTLHLAITFTRLCVTVKFVWCVLFLSASLPGVQRGVLAAAGAVVKVTPILYENPYGRDSDGVGCDHLSSGCDHYFTFCMRLAGSCIGEYTSSVYANSYGVGFDSGITSPMTFNFVDSYPVSDRWCTDLCLHYPL